ncbi:hypothetical protein KEM54_004712 [Ascosphaera aggregata]|nr:hypothetical protein KEM54_004712 [Ascosphaera aggregata]
MVAIKNVPTEYGSAMKQHILIDPEYTNLNHGNAPAPLSLPFPHYDPTEPFLARYSRAGRISQDEAEARIDPFIKLKQAHYIDESRSAIAKYLDVPTDECVFVKNATSGVNTALRNMIYKEGDVIIYFATVYGACEATIASLVETTPVEARRVEYAMPTTHDHIVEQFQATVEKTRADGLNVRAALFETVVSMPGVRFPFERLCEVCRMYGIYSVLDAAHGVGQIPLDLSQVHPEFCVSNCHKWFFCPRGSAVFYVPKRNQHLIRTTSPTSAAFLSRDKPIPRGSTKSRFELLFEWTGTDDDTPYLSFEGGNIVADWLQTDVMTEKGTDWRTPGVSQLRKCAFAMVRLPIRVVYQSSPLHLVRDRTYSVVRSEDVARVKMFLQTELYSRHRTFIPSVAHGGWTAQIYLFLDDSEFAGKAIKDVCNRCEMSELGALLILYNDTWLVVQSMESPRPIKFE